MKKKKLYLLTDGFPYGSGEKTFILPELEKLKDKFDVIIIADINENMKYYSYLENVKVVPYFHERIRKIDALKYMFSFLLFSGTWNDIKRMINRRLKIKKRLWKVFTFYIEAKKYRDWLDKNSVIDKEDDGIIYSYWYNQHVLAFTMEKDKYKKYKIITRAHGYDLYEEVTSSGWQPYKKYMDNKLDKVYFISDYGKDYYEKRYLKTKKESSIVDKYEMAKLGAPGEEYWKCKSKNKQFILFSCSNMIKLKRIDLIIGALAIINDFNIVWIHFGSGDLYESILADAKEKLANKKNIRFDFRGQVPNEEILNCYKIMQPSCFITTSSSEGSPISIQEALAYGIPIIGTKVGGIPELIDNNGVLLSENPTINEIAEAISKIYYSSQDEYLTYCKNSRKLWEHEYNQKENATKFLEKLVHL